MQGQRELSGFGIERVIVLLVFAGRLRFRVRVRGIRVRELRT